MTLAQLIKKGETDSLRFSPSNEFYRNIQIGKKRFWQLIREEKPANTDELHRIARYFEVSVKDLIQE
jgi:hypothetical protein